jgi:hypothetical protein
VINKSLLKRCANSFCSLGDATYRELFRSNFAFEEAFGFCWLQACRLEFVCCFICPSLLRGLDRRLRECPAVCPALPLDGLPGLVIELNALAHHCPPNSRYISMIRLMRPRLKP